MPFFRQIRIFLGLSVGLSFFFIRCDQATVTEATKEIGYAYQNHHPDVKYIGMAECATCHVDKYLTFQHTGKGRSFHAPDTSKIIEKFNIKPVFDTYSNLYYLPYWKGTDMCIHEFRLHGKDTVHSRIEKVDYVIGSGNQTRSYIRNVNGYLYEMPITWYVSKGIWDLSPGYEKGLNSRFNRPVGDQCMNCHNSNVQFEKHAINRFISVGEGIECEKCHGPGEAHMAAVINENEVKGTIVNPATLATELRFDICRQCHLEGVVVEKEGKDLYAYRPGMKLSDFYDVFIPAEQNETEFGFASHAERLQMSACFKGMNGEMACTNCHDPHQAIHTNTREYFNGKCLSCHSVNVCGEDHQVMAEANNDCVKCHMKKGGTEDIPHVSSTDHLIRVLKGEKASDEAHGTGLKEFKSFTSTHIDDRTKALLHMNYYEQFEGDIGYLERVAPLVKQLKPLEQARFIYLINNGHQQFDLTPFDLAQVNDPYACYHIYTLWKRKGKLQLRWLEKSVMLASDNQDFLFQLAKDYEEVDIEKSAFYYDKLLQKNPKHPQALVNYGMYWKEKGEFEKAVRHFQLATYNYPDYQLAKENLAVCYMEMNKFDEAATQLEQLSTQFPENTNYQQLLRRIRGL